MMLSGNRSARVGVNGFQLGDRVADMTVVAFHAKPDITSRSYALCSQGRSQGGGAATGSGMSRDAHHP